MFADSPRPAIGTFPYAGHRTVGEIWTDEKVQRELRGLREIERTKAVAAIMTGTVCGTCGGIPDPRCSHWNCPKKQAA